MELNLESFILVLDSFQWVVFHHYPIHTMIHHVCSSMYKMSDKELGQTNYQDFEHVHKLSNILFIGWI